MGVECHTTRSHKCHGNIIPSPPPNYCLSNVLIFSSGSHISPPCLALFALSLLKESVERLEYGSRAGVVSTAGGPPGGAACLPFRHNPEKRSERVKRSRGLAPLPHPTSETLTALVCGDPGRGGWSRGDPGAPSEGRERERDQNRELFHPLLKIASACPAHAEYREQWKQEGRAGGGGDYAICVWGCTDLATGSRPVIW